MTTPGDDRPADGEHGAVPHGGGRRPGLSRRAFLASSLAAAVAAACGDEGNDAEGGSAPTATPGEGTAGSGGDASPAEPTATPEPTAPPVELPGPPFTLGVASGDPTDTAVILWTRLAPDPLQGGGMPDTDVEVGWEVANDDGFADIVASGVAVASPLLGHSLHVDVTELPPDTWFHYRFVVGEYTSPVGRARTMPAAGAIGTPLRFGFSSCQNYEAGFYAAHRHAAAEELDLFVWLGDYIYEYGPGEFPVESVTGDVRVHNSPEIETLDDYRNRYALYKSDPDLQANHHARPWIVTWDDHEVDNDYADDISEQDDPPDAFLVRRAAGYQAWYEHQPVRLPAPEGPDYPIYRDLAWGDLAHLFICDGRQYRTDQPTDGEFIPIPGLDDESLPIRTLSPTALDPANSMLGAEQQDWLVGGLSASTAIWNVVGQQVFMHGLEVLPQDPPLIVTDTWDGYYGNRRELLQTLSDNGVENLVVLTGDFHSATVGDLRADPFDRETPVVGTEFMASSISSTFPQAAADQSALILGFNPQIKFFDARKGWCDCSVTPEAFQTTYWAVDDPTDADSAVTTIATFVVDAGTPGARPA